MNLIIATLLYIQHPKDSIILVHPIYKIDTNITYKNKPLNVKGAGYDSCCKLYQFKNSTK